MNTKNRNIASLLSFLCFACSLSGCGGAKLLKAPAPLEATDSLARAADGRLSATLEWVIVRDGPGTWARNADWDEYMIRVQNLNGEPVQITSIAVVDALGTVIQPRDSRKQLVAGTKETKRRYKDEGVKVEVGAGAGKLLAGAGIAAATGAAATMAAVGYGTAAGAATVGSIIFVPALAVGGVVRGVNNSKVNQQIESRHRATRHQVASDGDVGAIGQDTVGALTDVGRLVEVVFADQIAGKRVDADLRP